MNELVDGIIRRLGKNDDLFLEKFSLMNDDVFLIGLSSLVDVRKSKSELKKDQMNAKNDESWASLGKLSEGKADKAIEAILDGKLIINLENTIEYIVYEPETQSLNRSIESPTNETVVQGSMKSFTEDIDTNIGIVRKQARTEALSVHSFSIGSNVKRKLSVLSFDGTVDSGLLEQTIDRLNASLNKDTKNLQDLSVILGLHRWEIVSPFNTTELPSNAVEYLNKGRLIIFLDNFPQALIMPNLLWDMFVTENDKNFPIPIMLSIRLLRVIGVFIALISPGMYVALVSVNPELLQIQLALSVAQSREGVPYPAIVEILLLLLVLELIIEASVRLPQPIGPTITMVGGIILGQAAVDAKLVSTLLIIILAATTIANSTIVGVQQSNIIRFLKYVIVVAASIFGILGIVAGMVLISTYLARISDAGRSFYYFNTKKTGVENE
jgi:Bacillus/Clostridium GerA spore germination protein